MSYKLFVNVIVEYSNNNIITHQLQTLLKNKEKFLTINSLQKDFYWQLSANQYKYKDQSQYTYIYSLQTQQLINVFY